MTNPTNEDDLQNTMTITKLDFQSKIQEAISDNNGNKAFSFLSYTITVICIISIINRDHPMSDVATTRASAISALCGFVILNIIYDWFVLKTEIIKKFTFRANSRV